MCFQYLERRVAAQQADQLAEHAVMIDAVASANGSLTRAQRIPGNGKARFDVFPVVLVEWRSAFADLCEGERAWPVGRYEKNGQAILHFHGNAKEFVAQAVAESKIGDNFVGILRIKREFPLAEAALVRGSACAACIEELRLCLEINTAKKRPNEVLQVHAREHLLRSARSGFEAGTRGGLDAETGEHGGVGNCASSEIVGAIGVHIAILAADLE